MNTTVPDHQKKRLLAILVENEFPVWIGQPDRSKISERNSLHWIGIVLSAMAGSCSLVTSQVLRLNIKGDSSSYTLSGIILFIILAILPAMFYVLEYWISKDHLYAITNQRIVLLTPQIFADDLRIQSYGKRQITEITLQNLQPDGSGDLIFRREVYAKGGRVIGFFAISEAEKVRQLLLNTFEFDEHDFWSQ